MSTRDTAWVDEHAQMEFFAQYVDHPGDLSVADARVILTHLPELLRKARAFDRLVTKPPEPEGPELDWTNERIERLRTFLDSHHLAMLHCDEVPNKVRSVRVHRASCAALD